MNNYKIKKLDLVIIIFILIFGSILRVYQINYDDLWSDEMVSFWIADPNIEFKETINRIFSSNWMVLYEILLKYFHYFFSYNVDISRYFSLIISIASLVFFTLLLKKITNIKATIFGLFILSINIYHLGFSIELRSYILSFLLVCIFIYYCFNNNSNNNFINILILNLILIFMLLSHAFTLLVVGSYVVYLFLKILKSKTEINKDLYKIVSLIVSSTLFLIFYFQTTIKIIDPSIFKGISPDWMWQIKASFYTNFYFSKFFGSRILGLIHLVVLLGCIFYFKKKIYKNFDIFTFFIILIFFSYFIPLTYGYIFNPILLDRYIFFILIPIIGLLAHLIFQVKNKKIRIFLILLICLSSFLNNLLYENSFRKFYTSIYPSKPEVKKALNNINKSNIKFYTFKEDNRYSINTNLIIQNYLLKCEEKLNLKLKYIPFDNKDLMPEKLWVIYLKDTIDTDFSIPKKLSEYKLLQEKFFNRLDLYLLAK